MVIEFGSVQKMLQLVCTYSEMFYIVQKRKQNNKTTKHKPETIARTQFLSLVRLRHLQTEISVISISCEFAVVYLYIYIICKGYILSPQMCRCAYAYVKNTIMVPVLS